MKAKKFGPRNVGRGKSERASISSLTDRSGEGPRAALAEGTATRIKCGRGTIVDGAVGIGPADMPAEHIFHGLARILRRGVRTATVREIDGIPYVMTKGIPEGTFALRTADRITAYRAETVLPIVEVLCEAPPVLSGPIAG